MSLIFLFLNSKYYIPNSILQKAKSVREALDMLVTKDTLEGLTCPKTNKELDAYQQVTIDELPYVLLLHLKCFEYKQQKLTKIVKNVEFSVDLKIEPSEYFFILGIMQIPFFYSLQICIFFYKICHRNLGKLF